MYKIFVLTLCVGIVMILHESGKKRIQSAAGRCICNRDRPFRNRVYTVRDWPGYLNRPDVRAVHNCQYSVNLRERKKMRKLIGKIYASSVVRYVFFGGCTTLVNLASFYMLRRAGVGINIANLISCLLW